jgi:hypothetical protein
VYLLTPEQVKRYEDLKDTPFETTGSRHSIVYELQEECEHHGRVLYPIILESDAMDDNVQPEVMKEWLIQFVSQELSISPYVCAWFFSGGRSIHCHTPLFIQGEEHREAFKQKVERFTEREGIEFDTGIYDPKQTFRIPGVEHEKTGERKVPIGVDDSTAEICQAIQHGEVWKPNTYAELVKSVFGNSLQSGSSLPIWSPATPAKKEIPTPLVEQEHAPSDGIARQKWLQYNRWEFSPYTLAKPENPRSLFIGQVKDGAFCRRDKDGERAYLPCFIRAAIGCDTDYKINQRYGPLYLSKPDYDKMEFEPGDELVVIGGGNGRARIFKIPTTLATGLRTELYDEGAEKNLNHTTGRKRVLQILTEWGYDVGSSGMNGSRRSTSSSSLWDTGTLSDTQELRRRIERTSVEEIPEVEYTAVFRVCCGILKGEGWNEAWQWLQREYEKVGRFDPEQAYSELKKIVEWKPDDYAHIRIPETPTA